MRVIIAGTRFDERDTVAMSRRYAELEAVMVDFMLAHEVTQVVSGAARGVDWLGERWGVEHYVPVVRFPANWKLHGRRADVVRNTAMADNADALVALWDGESNSTLHMIGIARRMGLVVMVKTWGDS